MYGTTYEGGAVFSVPTTGGVVTTLVSSVGSNGALPVGNLALIGSTLYGTTGSGEYGFNPDTGNYCNGTVFSIGPVPEPSGFMALGIGAAYLAALGLWTRRRRVHLLSD